MNSSPILRLAAVTKRYGAYQAVNRVDLDIAEGEFFTLVGPSGSGKTTLLRMMAGFEQPSGGDILLRGKNVNNLPSNKRPTCMVFQSLALFNHMTVSQNIEYSLRVRNVRPEIRREKCLNLLKIVRLPENYYSKKVTQCSGGERQRIALARALAMDPEILFFDEPMSAIDYQLRKILEMELKDLHRETGKTFVYITHSLEEAMVMSDRIGILKSGSLVQVGTPNEIYDKPESEFVSRFMGEVNVIEVRKNSDGLYHSAELNQTFQTSGERAAPHGVIVVRPENIHFLEPGGRAENTTRGTLHNEYNLGSRYQYHIRSGERVWTVERPRDERLIARIGDEVAIGWSGAASTFIAQSGA